MKGLILIFEVMEEDLKVCREIADVLLPETVVYSESRSGQRTEYVRCRCTRIPLVILSMSIVPVLKRY